MEHGNLPSHLPAHSSLSPETAYAFRWLTAPGSAQAGRVETNMREYAQPIYDLVDVGRQLMRLLAAPMARFDGDAAKVDMLKLAYAVTTHAVDMGWDVVPERSGQDEGSC